MSGEQSPPARLMSNFWSLPVLLTGLSVVLLAGLLAADHAGGSAWLAAQGWPWSASGDTVLQTASTATTVVVTLVSLFFSITLLVLTIAASNLGVRLIDRWVDRVAVRFTLSLLLALLAYALLLQAAIEPDGPDSQLPRLTLAVLLGALVPTLGWLAYAFHRLARLIHVDTSIAELGDDLREAVEGLVARAAGSDWLEEEPVVETAVAAARAGYVTALDLDALVDCAGSAGGIRLPALGTRFVRAGEPIAFVSEGVAPDRVRRAIHVSRYRREGAGAPFHVALLVEVAVRALSPALNDIFTALACVDRLRDGLSPAFASGRLDGRFGAGGVSAPGLSARGLIDEPLAILRNAAAPLPTMSLRLAAALEGLAAIAGASDDAGWLRDRAREVAEQALGSVEAPSDRDALQRTIDRVQSTSP